jgi:hypothetical protein
VGVAVGSSVGAAVGSSVGAAVGVAVGSSVGAGVGYCRWGWRVRMTQVTFHRSIPRIRRSDSSELTPVGAAVGSAVGSSVGDAVGYCRARDIVSTPVLHTESGFVQIRQSETICVGLYNVTATHLRGRGRGLRGGLIRGRGGGRLPAQEDLISPVRYMHHHVYSHHGLTEVGAAVGVPVGSGVTSEEVAPGVGAGVGAAVGSRVGACQPGDKPSMTMTIPMRVNKPTGDATHD